jgi:hypothetical protein
MGILGLTPLGPYMFAIRMAAYAGVAAGIFGAGAYVDHRFMASDVAQAKLVCSQMLLKQAQDAFKRQTVKDEAAAESLKKVTEDVQSSERARQLLATQNSALAAAYKKLSTDLRASNHDLGMLRTWATSYVSGATGADSPACAAVAGRARYIGDLFDQSLGLLQQASNLLAEGSSLAGSGAEISADAAAVAEQLAVQVRGWQDRYRTVENTK